MSLYFPDGKGGKKMIADMAGYSRGDTIDISGVPNPNGNGENGGILNASGGAGSISGGKGGVVNLNGGSGATQGNGGTVSMTGATGGAIDMHGTSGNGGNINMSGRRGGSINMKGATGNGTNVNGGSGGGIELTGGDAKDALLGGNGRGGGGGGIDLSGGAGSLGGGGGSILLNGGYGFGEGRDVGGNGGTIELNGGDGAGDGGTINLQGGIGGGSGGNINLDGGRGGGGIPSGNGGIIYLRGGDGAGDGGTIDMTGATGGTIDMRGAFTGGTIKMSGVLGNGGTIELNGGDDGGGDGGTIKLNGGHGDTSSGKGGIIEMSPNGSIVGDIVFAGTPTFLNGAIGLSVGSGGSSYVLQTASTSIKGGIKVGNGLVMNGDSLNATPSAYTSATTVQSGLMSASDKAKLDSLDGSKYVATVSGKGLSTNDYTNADKNKLASLTNYSNATTSQAGLMSAADKTKLNNLASITTAGTNITISGGSISAAGYTLPTASTSTKGGVKVGAGLTMDGDTLKCTVSSGEVYSNATTAQSGLMSATDKTKLDNLASITTAGDNITISDGTISAKGYAAATTAQSGLMSASDKTKLTNLASITTAGANITITNGTIKAADTTYNNATTVASGLMSAADKEKLNKSMPKSGGAFTGDVYLGTNDAPTNIVLPTIGAAVGNALNSRSFSGMKLIGQCDSLNASYGYDVLVQGANKLILASGEAGLDAYNSTLLGSNSIKAFDDKENAYLLAADNVFIATDCDAASTVNAKIFIFDKSGNITADKFTGNVNANNATISANNATISGSPKFTGTPTLSGGVKIAGNINIISNDINANNTSISAWLATINADQALITHSNSTVTGDFRFAGVPTLSSGMQVGNSSCTIRSVTFSNGRLQIGVDNTTHSFIPAENSTVSSDVVYIPTTAYDSIMANFTG